MTNAIKALNKIQLCQYLAQYKQQSGFRESPVMDANVVVRAFYNKTIWVQSKITNGSSIEPTS